MASNDIRIVPCVPPDGARNPEGALWWKAVLNGEDLAVIGAYPWELDNAMCLCLDEIEALPFLEVTTEMVETVLRFASRAGFGGVYAITYEKDTIMPIVLDSLGFDRVESGREWSDNPTIYWFREGL